MRARSTSGLPAAAGPRVSRRRRRALAVAAAVAAALSVWAVAELLLGIDVREPSGGRPEDIGLRGVVVTAAGASLAGWALLAVLERWTARARTLWTAAAAVVFAASLWPLLDAVVPLANRGVLLMLHAAVAAVAVTLLPDRRRGPGSWPGPAAGV